MAAGRRRPSSARSGDRHDCAVGPRRSHGMAFEAYLTQVLVPTLESCDRGAGESRSTQAGRDRPCNRGGRRPAPLSAALFARPSSPQPVLIVSNHNLLQECSGKSINSASWWIKQPALQPPWPFPAALSGRPSACESRSNKVQIAARSWTACRFVCAWRMRLASRHGRGPRSSRGQGQPSGLSSDQI